MNNETDYDKAVRIKGYGSNKRHTSNSQIEKTVVVRNDLKVKPKVIRTLSEYVDFIKQLKDNPLNPIFYRGQTNANYLLTPNSMRPSPKNEHLMLEEFERHFPGDFPLNMRAMEKLSLMQHYLLPTRAMDVTENPLMALYFACSHMKKFRTCIIDPNDEEWGEVVLFREEETANGEKPEKLKSITSSNISIIANTAFMENNFSLWHLGAGWKNDGHLGYDETYIDLKTVVRSSLIVRVPFVNPRIKNQQGAFIMCNANYVVDEDNNIYFGLTNYILNGKDKITYDDLQGTRFGKNLTKTKTWLMKFRKVVPYDSKNEIKIFETDPFNLTRLFYKENNVQRVVLIPPECKRKILDELKSFNISEEFVYPDMDNVAHEIKIRYEKN